MQAPTAVTKSRTRKPKSMKSKKADVQSSKPASTAKSPPSSDKNQTHDCDFDQSPTKLYLLIQHKKWDEVIARARSHPVEARTWITRKEDTGKIRWRLLPLHASLIFKAPEKIIESLLMAFPFGAQCKDDQGMIPLHLAFRNGGTEITVNMLICANPHSVEVTDRKGRIPFKLAQGAANPLKDFYINALQRAPVYYAVAAQSCSEVGVYNSSSATRIVDAEKLNLMGKLESMTKELKKAEETSKVLVNHVNSLEAELNSKIDVESVLNTKVDALEKQVKELSSTRESNEAEFVSKSKYFEEERFSLLEKVELQRTLLEEKEKSLNSISTSKFDTRDAFDNRFEKLESDRASAMANAAVLEGQLRLKSESEHSLSTQVSDLAAKLAESATKSCQAAEHYVAKIEGLEHEKVSLQHNLSEVTSSLFQTLKNLDNMSKEQESILEIAAKHEETMKKAMDDHENIVSISDQQEQILSDAKWEREEMLRILTLQSKNAEKIHVGRVELGQKVVKQKEYMAVVDKERDVVVESISKQRANMGNLKKEIKELYKVLVDDDDIEIDSDDDEEEVAVKEETTIEKDTNEVENRADNEDGVEDKDELEDDGVEDKDELKDELIEFPPRPTTENTTRSTSEVSALSSKKSTASSSQGRDSVSSTGSSSSYSSHDSEDDESEDGDSGHRSRESSRERSREGDTISVADDSVEILCREAEEAINFVP